MNCHVPRCVRELEPFGLSAGIQHLFPRRNTAGLSDLTALKLTDIEAMPHYSRFIRRFEHFGGKRFEYEAAHPGKAIRLYDGEAIII